MLQKHLPKKDSVVILGRRLASWLAQSHLPTGHLDSLPVVTPGGRGGGAAPRGGGPQGHYGLLPPLVPGKVTRWGRPVVFCCVFRGSFDEEILSGALAWSQCFVRHF